jgi:hypothetical protein
MGPIARVDYNLTLCRLQSRLQHMYHGRPYARVDLNPMPEPTFSTSKELGILPQGTLAVHVVKKISIVLNIDASSDPNSTFHFEADPDSDPVLSSFGLRCFSFLVSVIGVTIYYIFNILSCEIL